MKKYLRRLPHILFSFLVSLTLAASYPALGDAELVKSIAESQSLIIENNNLSAAAFHSAYLSKNITERRYAEMYLLGVLDATEGKDWCDYKGVKTITLDEAVFVGFKKLDREKLKARASTVIKEMLSRNFTCRKSE
jgi:Rap1a immunity proteins